MTNPNLAALATLLVAEASRLEVKLDEYRDQGFGRVEAAPELRALYIATDKQYKAARDAATSLRSAL